MPWKTFLKAHFGVITATDFFTVEVLTLGGLVRYVVWFQHAFPSELTDPAPRRQPTQRYPCIAEGSHRGR